MSHLYELNKLNCLKCWIQERLKVKLRQVKKQKNTILSVKRKGELVVIG